MEWTPEYIASVVQRALKHSREMEWIEFKHNNDNAEMIGEYISALANAAAVNNETHGYLIWGIADGTSEIVGTSFSPGTTRRGNQPLESWLHQKLEPACMFRFLESTIEGKRVVLMQVDRAITQPVRFSGIEYIRIGAVTKKLAAAPERARELYRSFETTPFEQIPALENVSDARVVELLDVGVYFKLLKIPEPPSRAGVMEVLEADAIVRRNPSGEWDITNLGGLLFARKLSAFPGLSRKAVRVIAYRGRGKDETLREITGSRGYAVSFTALLSFLQSLLPTTEVVRDGIRRNVPAFPELAVRELVANALIHQDLGVTGAGPTFEVFDGRLEITNPGLPLVDPDRFLDLPSRSRNEALAALCRRMGMCEERGSGIDKVVVQIELNQLPPPLFEAPPGSTRVTLYGPKPHTQMSRDERIRACYFHACLQYVRDQPVTNASLRARFGIDEGNSAIVSRYLNDAVEAGALVVENENQGRRHRRYLPHWASRERLTV